MRQKSVDVDIPAWKYVNLLSIRELFTIVLFMIIYFLRKQNLFQKSLGHMTWKLLRKNKIQ